MVLAVERRLLPAQASRRRRRVLLGTGLVSGLATVAVAASLVESGPLALNGADRPANAGERCDASPTVTSASGSQLVILPDGRLDVVRLPTSTTPPRPPSTCP